MAKLTWDETGNKLYETGIDRVVIYPYSTANNAYGAGVAWSGITSISESPSGADNSDLYADNIKYLSLRAAEEFGASIEAYTYPDEFAVLDGSVELVSGVKIGQQTRGIFALSYRTIVGNDTLSNDYGYKIHLVYGASVSPSEKQYSTVNDSPEAISFSWELTTNPVNVTGYKPTSIVTIDSTKFTTVAQKAALAAFEEIIYGRNADSTASPAIEALEPRIPLPDEVKTLLTVAG